MLSPTATLEQAGHFLVGFDGTPQDLITAVEAAGGTVERVHPQIGAAKVSGLSDEAAAGLVGTGGISQVARDVWVQWAPGISDLGFDLVEAPAGAGAATDPTTASFFPCQWNMRQVNLPDVWSQGALGNPAVKVAVLDSGTDPNHQDLVGRVDLAESASFLSYSPCGAADTGTINDLAFHGTFVSGIITSNGLGVAGVAPETQIVAVKVLRCDNFGSFADILAGIMYAATLPDVHVINMSIQAYFPKSFSQGQGGFLLAKHNEAVDYAVSQGKVVIVAAGNFGIDLDHDQNGVELPAQAGGAVGIWAGDANGHLASYSNHGRSGTWVGAGGGDGTPPDYPLPGCTLLPIYTGGVIGPCTTFYPPCASGNFYFVGGTGTSFASPLVAGVAALADGKADGALTARALRELLANTADDVGVRGVDNLFSHGRVNAFRAVFPNVANDDKPTNGEFQQDSNR